MPATTFTCHIYGKTRVTMFGKTRQFRRYLQDIWPDMYRIAYSWCRDREMSADLVQETLSRCLQQPEKFTHQDDLRIWLFKVMRNCWRDHLRRIRPGQPVDEGEQIDPSNPELEYHRNQLMQQVNQAFVKLSFEHREILSLVAIQGMSYEETARILDLPPGTVMSRLCRARNQLKLFLKDIKLQNDSATLRRIK